VRERFGYVIKFLPFELPSKKDPAWAFIRKAWPYNITGALVLILVPLVIRSARPFPRIWFTSLVSLPDPFQIFVHSVLTLLWLWTLSYSVGVLMIEKSRRYYREFIVRPLEKGLQSQD
jgi:hypothetical protein